MLDGDAWARLAATGLRPQHFYDPEHRIIFDVLTGLSESGRPLDVVVVSTELSKRGFLDRVGGNSKLAELVDSTLGTSNLETYAESVIERARRRDLMRLAREIQDGAGGREKVEDIDALFSTAIGRLTEMSRGSGASKLRSIGDVLEDALTDIEEWRERSPGLVTGFPDLDDKAGLRPGNLVIVAARPSMGKTALMFNIAVNVAREGGCVLVYSLEQSAKELTVREASRATGIDLHSLSSGRIDGVAWDAVRRIAEDLSKTRLFIDDEGALTPAKIRSRTQAFVAEHGGLDALFIDYLGLLVPDRRRESRNIDVGEITRCMKALAKELDVPVVLLSQLNRGVEQRQEKRPVLADLRDSGSIEQDADVVLLLYRDEVYDKDSDDKGIAEVIVGKQRNGPTGVVKVRFDAATTSFLAIDAPAAGSPDYAKGWHGHS